MPEEPKNTSDTDLSGMFSTYKTHHAEGETQYIPSNIQITPVMTVKNDQTNNQEGTIEIPQCDTPFQKRMYFFETFSRSFLKGIKLIIDGSVRLTKVAVWSVAVLGGLFVAALATNTIDRAISIINSNI
ncbi:MAG: hypothetical protein WCK88_07900 [bacterium]